MLGGLNPSLKRPACQATLKNRDTTKQSVCGGHIYIYIYIYYIYIYIYIYNIANKLVYQKQFFLKFSSKPNIPGF